MARKTKSSNNRNRNDSPENEDDTKFYIKFKDPRSKSQIFYYFNEEDIFDPCIPLNQGDIVNDSAAVVVEKPKPNVTTSERKKVEEQPPKSKTQRAPLPYFEDSTLQVQTASFLPPAKEKKKVTKIPGFDDTFEDVGYMTAMDLKFVPDDEEDAPFEEEKEEEEEFHNLEEYVEPVKLTSKNLSQIRTAIETIKNPNESDFLVPVPLKKEEFDLNTSSKECAEYKNWADKHLTKHTIPARLISPAEFRLLKKLIGLKTK